MGLGWSLGTHDRDPGPPSVAIPSADCGVKPHLKEVVICGNSHLRPLPESQGLEDPRAGSGGGYMGDRRTIGILPRPGQLWKAQKETTSLDHGDPTGESGRRNPQGPNLLDSGRCGEGGGLRLYLKRQGRSGLPQIKAGSPVFDSQTSPVGGCFRNWRPLAVGPRESSERVILASSLCITAWLPNTRAVLTKAYRIVKSFLVMV